MIRVTLCFAMLYTGDTTFSIQGLAHLTSSADVVSTATSADFRMASLAARAWVSGGKVLVRELERLRRVLVVRGLVKLDSLGERDGAPQRQSSLCSATRR